MERQIVQFNYFLALLKNNFCKENFVFNFGAAIKMRLRDLDLF